jgi:hypothetical protein
MSYVLSASDAKTALVTALQQLATSYQTAFAPLNCDSGSSASDDADAASLADAAG